MYVFVLYMCIYVYAEAVLGAAICTLPTDRGCGTRPPAEAVEPAVRRCGEQAAEAAWRSSGPGIPGVTWRASERVSFFFFI